MKYTQLKRCAVLCLGLGISGLNAQETNNTAGGNAVGSGGSVSYSVGQVFYTSSAGSSASIAQGVQQPFEISVLDVTDSAILDITIVAYPNPTSDELNLVIKDFDLADLSVQLFDMQGKMIRNQIIKSKRTQISMNRLPVATYFVKINKGSNHLKTFKIIKK